ncbi:MAG: ferredoxin, partial [Actinoallomurus sp.]|nr:ferredoxin [Actinoallomurus sp.]
MVGSGGRAACAQAAARAAVPARFAGAGMSGGTLIVGGSQAGLQLAVSLRQLGDTSPIVLVGEEAYPPYQRPPLSKEFLAGEAEP